MSYLSIEELLAYCGSLLVKYTNAYEPLTLSDRREVAGSVVLVGVLGTRGAETVSVLPGSHERIARDTLGRAFDRARVVAVGDASRWAVVKDGGAPPLLAA